MARRSVARATLIAATATSLVGLSLASAVAVPRLRWRNIDNPTLLGGGADTWRRLRSPSAALPGGVPDVAVPTIDAEEKWVLYGLLSGQPIEGVGPAPAVPLEPGSVRILSNRPRGMSPLARKLARTWPAAAIERL